MNNRQEQIEQARRLIATGISSDLIAVLHQQFPELKESEDERIKKEIIDWMKGGNTYKWQDNKDRWTAYLERQKEPLTPEEKMNHPLYLEGFDVGKKVGEVLKEKHPAEWSEEDENITVNKIPIPVQWTDDEKKKLDRIYQILGWAMDEHAFSSTKRLIGDKEGIELQDFLRSIAKPIHWKPSEEQMDDLNFIITALRKDYCDGMADFLASLYHDLQKLL